MKHISELETQTIYILFDEMGKILALHGSTIAFVQLRVSAEHFVVPLCGLAVERTLRTLAPSQFHVRFEKKPPQFTKGPVDLVVIPLMEEGKEDLCNPYCFEFKMVWLEGLKGHISGLKHDIAKLFGYHTGYVVGVLFSFDGGPDWAPYTHEGNMGQLVKKVVAGVGPPAYQGEELAISNQEVTGNLKLLAWAASISGAG